MDFFDFKLLISSYLVRAAFVLATCGLALILIFAPLSYIGEYAAANDVRAKRIQAIATEKRNAEEVLTKLPPLETAVENAIRERDKFANQPNFKMAYRDADIVVAKAKGEIEKLLRPFLVKDRTELEKAIIGFDRDLAAVPPTKIPSPIPVLSAVGGAVLAWVLLRLALELYCVLFAIHERLTEIRDLRVRGVRGL